MMLKTTVATGIALLASLCVSAAPTDSLILSREKCVEIALSENPTIRVADLEVKRLDYSKRETLASLFPSIDFQGAYQRAIE